MKKIVSAAAAALILGGFAAAEATFSVNYRTGIEVLSHQMKSNTHLLNATTASRTTSDALSFKGKADFGGLELEITPTYSNDGAEGTLSLAKYNGWINFGKFSFKSGAWDSRAVGRVNADMGNHEGKFWGELQKPGLANKLGTSGNGVDISQQNGKKKITNMLSYTDKDMGLEVRGAFIDSSAASYAKTDDDGDDFEFENDVWFAEVGYTIKDVGRIMVTTKDSYKDQSFALFVEPKLADLKALTSLVGVTYEQNTSGGDDLTQTAIGIDARVRYAIDDQLSLTAMYNWTGGDALNTAKTGKVAKYATWGMLNATYKLNETFVPFCSMIYSSGAAAGTAGALGFKDTYAASLRVYPGVEIYNTKSANLITGLVVDLVNFTGEDDDFVKKFTIPVLMRVKF